MGQNGVLSSLLTADSSKTPVAGQKEDPAQTKEAKQ